MIFLEVLCHCLNMQTHSMKMEWHLQASLPRMASWCGICSSFNCTASSLAFELLSRNLSAHVSGCEQKTRYLANNIGDSKADIFQSGSMAIDKYFAK